MVSILAADKGGQPVFLPVPPDMQASIDQVPPPMRNVELRYFLWTGIDTPETHKAHLDRGMRTSLKESGVEHPRAPLPPQGRYGVPGPRCQF